MPRQTLNDLQVGGYRADPRSVGVMPDLLRTPLPPGPQDPYAEAIRQRQRELQMYEINQAMGLAPVPNPPADTSPAQEELSSGSYPQKRIR